jgi:biopolymer transport protein ExbD
MRRKLRREERKALQASRHVTINVVSLIDIFAILVFYLLVSALAVEIIPMQQALKLPESGSRDLPQQRFAIVITQEEILVENQKVMSTAQALKAGKAELSPLLQALEKVPLQQDGQTGRHRGEANILADREIPFRLLRSVMAACTQARFERISLAVVEKAGSGS